MDSRIKKLQTIHKVGVSINTMARDCGISPQTMAKILHGKQERYRKDTVEFIDDYIDWFWATVNR